MTIDSSYERTPMGDPPDPPQTTRGGIPTDSFAHRLMLARAHAGHISIREAADLCGLGRGAWTNWERGTRPVDLLDAVDAIAAKLGVDRDWLLFGGQLAQELGRRTRVGGRSVGPNSRSARLTERAGSVTGSAASAAKRTSAKRRHRVVTLSGRPAGEIHHPPSSVAPTHRRPQPTRRADHRMGG